MVLRPVDSEATLLLLVLKPVDSELTVLFVVLSPVDSEATPLLVVLSPVDSEVTTIATLPGGNYTEAFGINNLGQVVGLAESSLGPRAFLWTSNGSILDLNDLVSGLPSGMVLTGAFAINDKGQIVAFGLVHPNVSKNKEAHLDNHVHAGPTHVFLLTPQTAASSSPGP